MTTIAPPQPSRATTHAVPGRSVTPWARVRQFAWLGIVVADAGLLLWGGSSPIRWPTGVP
jgi:hypothetical protein